MVTKKEGLTMLAVIAVVIILAVILIPIHMKDIANHTVKVDAVVVEKIAYGNQATCIYQTDAGIRYHAYGLSCVNFIVGDRVSMSVTDGHDVWGVTMR